MLPEKQRVAIAEFAWWEVNSDIQIAKCPKSAIRHRGPYGKMCHTDWVFIPNYLNDLNAMHEAEKILMAQPDYQLCNKYASLVNDLVEQEILKQHPGCVPDAVGMEWIHASAPQRAEALLRTIGKWENDL